MTDKVVVYRVRFIAVNDEDKTRHQFRASSVTFSSKELACERAENLIAATYEFFPSPGFRTEYEVIPLLTEEG
jgi:hypothetical protein